MKLKNIIDISMNISRNMPVWPGDDRFGAERVLSLENNDPCSLTTLRMSVHTGTHADAPSHFLLKGDDIAKTGLERFAGDVKIFEIGLEEKCISAENISSIEIKEGDAVFFKTSNSRFVGDGEFKRDYVYIHSSAAQLLADKKVRTVGIDYLSVDSFDDEEFSAHRILLSAGIGILEGLYLKDVLPGEYFFSALPLKMEGIEGSPVRAVLMEFEE